MVIRPLCCLLCAILLCCHGAAAQQLQMAPTAAGCWAHLDEELLLWVKPAEQFSLSSDAVVQARVHDGSWRDLDQWSQVGDGLWNSLEIRWQVPYVQPGLVELAVDAVFATPTALVRRGAAHDWLLVLGEPAFTWENGESIAGGTWHAVLEGRSVIFAEQRIWPQSGASVTEQALIEPPTPNTLQFVGPRGRLAPGQMTTLEVSLPNAAGREVTIQWPVSLRQHGNWTVDDSVIAHDPVGRQTVTVHVPENGGLLRSAFHVLLHPEHGSGQFVVTMDGEVHVFEPQWRDMDVPQSALVLSTNQRHTLMPGLRALSQDHVVRWLWLEPLTAQILTGAARRADTWLTVDVGRGDSVAQAAAAGGGLRWNGETLRLNWVDKHVGQSLVLNAKDQQWQVRSRPQDETWTLGDWRWSGSGRRWSGVFAFNQRQVRVDLSDKGSDPFGSVHWSQEGVSLSYSPSKASVEASLGGVKCSWSPSQRHLQLTGETLKLEWRSKPSGWQTALDLNTELGMFGAAFGVDTTTWLRAEISKGALHFGGHWRSGMTTLSALTAHQGKRLQLSVGTLLTWEGEAGAAFSRWRWQYAGDRITLRWGPDFQWAANHWSWDAAVGCVWEPLPGFAVYGQYHTRSGWTWQLGWATTMTF